LKVNDLKVFFGYLVFGFYDGFFSWEIVCGIQRKLQENLGGRILNLSIIGLKIYSRILLSTWMQFLRLG
jgi:hypothetical protein